MIYLYKLMLLSTNHLYGQEWTSKEICQANTAMKIDYLTDVEMEAVVYINLARMYPKKFLTLYVINYEVNFKSFSDSFLKSKLITKLKSMDPLPPLKFDSVLYTSAKCFAVESGVSGYKGPEHHKCKKDCGAEVCSYGIGSGKYIALHWLIFSNVDREVCLSKSYTKIGIAAHTHKLWRNCAVGDLN